MAERSWKDLYDSDGTDVVEEDWYAIEVSSAEPHQSGGRTLFLGLNVLEGPTAGKKPQANLYLPDPSAEKFRGQLFNFKKRIAGFDLGAALAQMDPDGDIGTQLGILADAIRGQRTSAKIGKRKEGEYAGTNELLETKPLSGAVPAPPQVTDTQTITQADVAPVPAAVTETDEVAALKAQLAAAEAANGAGASEAALAAVSTGELPEPF